MTKHCTLKESFIEKQLDKFQPGWRDGKDITAETKQKIRDYVTSQLPDELKDDVTCITDYSIWHMAKKIRERENLPEPTKSNKGKKVSKRKPSDENQHVEMSFNEVIKTLEELIKKTSLNTFISALDAIRERHAELQQ